MDIKVYLKEKQELINKELDVLLPSEDTYPQILHKAMRHSLFSGGKRIRPIIMLAVCEMFDCPIDKVMPVACAIEMIHTGSLIFDDLPPIDNADLRRNNPTCHKIYGDGVAMLASYSLVARAVEIVSEAKDIDKETLTKVSKVISNAVGSMGMAGGQAVELANCSQQIAPKMAEYIHMNKTAKLFMAAVESAALVAGAKEEDINNLKGYAKNIGMAFQIRDDILDCTSEYSVLGKDTKQDKNQSFVNIFGLKNCENMLDEYIGKSRLSSEKLPNNGLLMQIAEILSSARIK